MNREVVYVLKPQQRGSNAKLEPAVANREPLDQKVQLEEKIALVLAILIQADGVDSAVVPEPGLKVRAG